MNDINLEQSAPESCCFPYTHTYRLSPAEILQRSVAGQQAADYRRQDPVFADWASGYGVIQHSDLTQVRVFEMTGSIAGRHPGLTRQAIFRRLATADRLASAAMWLVVHMTYARNVYLDGRDLGPDDFKPNPDGHTGGALNMAIGYVGYLVANAITGITRSWLMGQGHCVAAIDATNVIVGNMTPAHAARYDFTDQGLTRLVRDFYSYRVKPDGSPESPLGSHVNAYTAGGVMEGGYLGFAELQYVHMPLPNEQLVAFLSDGAFEEQRGSDWAPRWWRAEDSGMVLPIMVLNGRRIEERSEIEQKGGKAWFREHLRLNGFDPIEIDGRDPAAYAWAIFEMERRFGASSEEINAGRARYPVSLPYAIAEVPKGYGFPGAASNLAHNLPLGANPSLDAMARAAFNTGARALWVPPFDVSQAVKELNHHEEQQRFRERDHPLACRYVSLPNLPPAPWRELSEKGTSPMDGIDRHFAEIVRVNQALRPRVGNPDELRSNRMNTTLDILKHRVIVPEPGIAEAINGKVITALNEEAVVCAALANKGGINMVVSYEAFAVKMLGAIRQEIIFARHQKEAGHTPAWLSMPVVLTSHTWENGKNEQSHQDPTFCEALLAEMADVSRVLYPADWNSAVAALRAVYSSHGQIWTLVVPKKPTSDRFTAAQAEELMQTGAVRLRGSGEPAEEVLLAAIGAYQLGEALRAADRLKARGIAHSLVYVIEPGRLRDPRDSREHDCVVAPELRERLYPASAWTRVILTHTRPEPLYGILRPLDTGAARTRILGYINRGGTLNTAGMLFANRCTWAHALEAVAQGLGCDPGDLLDSGELAAIRGQGDPAAVLGEYHE